MNRLWGKCVIYAFVHGINQVGSIETDTRGEFQFLLKLAKYVDTAVLVFNAAATRRGAALRTVRELKEVGANVVGCVLLGARAMRGGYFHEQYKSYRKYQGSQVAGAPA